MGAQRGPQGGHWALSRVDFSPITVERVSPDGASSSPKMPSSGNGLGKPAVEVMTENVGIQEVPSGGTEGAPGPQHLDLHPPITRRAAIHQPEPCVLWGQRRISEGRCSFGSLRRGQMDSLPFSSCCTNLGL